MKESDLRTLDEFIRFQEDSDIPRSEWVSFPGFTRLYIRYGPRYICGERYQNVFTFSNGTALARGQRVVDKLLRYLVENYKNMTFVIFECVLDDSLQSRLESLGFKPINTIDWPLSYYMEFNLLKETVNENS